MTGRCTWSVDGSPPYPPSVHAHTWTGLGPTVWTTWTGVDGPHDPHAPKKREDVSHAPAGVASAAAQDVRRRRRLSRTNASHGA
jgi:hypothetical protein